MIQPGALVELQNGDGGWGYRGANSWTEPTCYAVMALGVAGLSSSPEARRGLQWIVKRQRKDGGWPPRDGVDESTWVTALVLLVDGISEPQAKSGADWLQAQTGRESSLVYRLRMRLLGVRLESPGFEGWPWFPGTAAWVTPTALSILALEKIARRTPTDALRGRIDLGQRFLLERRCRDGGWNHGSTKALGYDSDSYPETTGAALLALHGRRTADLERSEAVARAELQNCASAEAASWLRLGLIARGQNPEPVHPAGHGGTVETALALLADAAAGGKNAFLA